MEKETKEALERIRAAIAGKGKMPTLVKKVRHIPIVGLAAGDVLLACAAAEEDETVAALRTGCLAGKPDREVGLQVNHVQHLLDQVEKKGAADPGPKKRAAAAAAAPPAGSCKRLYRGEWCRMANMLEEGMAFLAGEMIEHCSALVIVQVGTLEILVSAVKGRSEIEVDDGVGEVRLISSDRDYIFKTADLVIAGVAQLPERHWRIREAVGGVVEVYEVLAPDKRKQVFNWCDEFRTAVRVHCKLVKTEL
jgi:hypothetical protein